MTPSEPMPMTTDDTTKRAIELLNELLTLKSERDGIQRPLVGVLGPAHFQDQFGRDVQEVATLMFAAREAVPLMQRLSAIGRSLAADGSFTVEFNESYASKALDHLLMQATGRAIPSDDVLAEGEVRDPSQHAKPAQFDDGHVELVVRPPKV